jgi:fatty-acyl-CoA synthase
MNAPSYVCGLSSLPLLGETIGARFDAAASRWQQLEAIVVWHQNIRWSYTELRRRVDELAAGLLALGLVPGDRIGIWSPNNAEWVLTQFASAKAGLILVTVNPAYRTLELQHALRKSGCKALVTARSFKSSNYLEMLKAVAPEISVSEPGRLQAKQLPELRWVIAIGEQNEPGMLRFTDLMQRGAEPERRQLEEISEQLQFDEPINIQFTSGTTGAPKGATLTHHNLLNNAFFVAEAMGLREGDRLCIPVPLYHCFGMVMSTLACVTHGATMVFPSTGFDPLAVLEAVEAERCTALHGVPTMFIAEMEHPEFQRFNLTSLRAGIMAGSPCPIEVMRR